MMKIADEDAVLIKNLYLSKGWGALKLLNFLAKVGNWEVLTTRSGASCSSGCMNYEPTASMS